MQLHPEIVQGLPLVATIEQVWARAMRWIAKRANELCPDGKPRRSALEQACNESGLQITEQMRRQIWEENQRELDDTTKCPIVVVSEKEYYDEIEKARARGDLMIGKF